LVKRVASKLGMEASIIRAIIKRKCPTVSVKRGTGTAFSYIEVQGKARGGMFTPAEIQCLKRNFEDVLGHPGSNFEVVGPEEKKPFIAKYGTSEEKTVHRSLWK